MSSSIAEEASLKKGTLPQGRKARSRRLTWLLILLVALIVMGLAVGLGVGLTVGRSGGDNNEDGASNDTPTGIGSPANFTNSPSATYWKPAAGLSWNYELQDTINSTSTDSISVWDIDLFNNDADTIQGLQSNGAKVICYFSAGSYENWRPDASKFASADLGNDLAGWPGERWLNISSTNVRSIMEARMDMAVQKHCDGVDPDNVDGYDNDNGLGLTQNDSIAYMEYLADAAHGRNLSIGLKNAGAILSSVIDGMQWSVNEQCTQYQECSTYALFIKQGKPVFHVEYPKGDDTNNANNVSAATQAKYCNDADASGFSTILKNIDLDSWIEAC